MRQIFLALSLWFTAVLSPRRMTEQYTLALSLCRRTGWPGSAGPAPPPGTPRSRASSYSSSALFHILEQWSMVVLNIKY